VRKVANLRPISQATDMAAVQDGLWLLRSPFLLEHFTGLSQMGGKFDTIAVIIALILHIQIRHLQGLDTYILFADLKWAFDTADQETLLVTCYLAGIVETEWLLLFDFFLMDSAFIQLNGVLSAALKLRAGVPQGRKFAVQSFTSLMVFYGFSSASVVYHGAFCPIHPAELCCRCYIGALEFKFPPAMAAGIIMQGWVTGATYRKIY